MRERAAVAALTGAAVGLFLAAPTYPNYDAYYDLVWGREILHGQLPTFQAYQAPTQHPLYVALGTVLAALFGTHADRALVLIAALSQVALAWAVYRVGRACFGTWAGLLAALFVVSSFAFLLYAARAYVDMPFLAVVLWAAVVEVEARGRRPRLVMALLTIAGLLRPEAWLLAGLYWLWGIRAARAARRLSLRLDLLAIAVVAPALWAISDGVVTGDPLHSIHATSDLADELHRTRGLHAIPGAFVSFVFDVARPPVAIAGVLGIAVALRRPAGVRALHVPLALLCAGALTFLATGAAGLSILERYLTVPVVALCLFAGHSVAWLGRRRVLAVAMVAVAALFVVFKLSSFGKLERELRFIHQTHRDLVAVVHDPAVRRARACGPVTLPNYRLVPDTKWVLDSERVGARSAKERRYGVALFVNGQKALTRYGFADAASPITNAPQPGYVIVARHGTFTAYASCPPRRA